MLTNAAEDNKELMGKNSQAKGRPIYCRCDLTKKKFELLYRVFCLPFYLAIFKVKVCGPLSGCLQVDDIWTIDKLVLHYRFQLYTNQ